MTGTALETVRTGSAISTELAGLADSARDYAANSRAVNTTRAYGFAWASFTTWCDQHGVEAMPATPGAVALFLTSRAGSGAKVATLRLALAAISAVHREAGQAFDAKAPGLVQVWSGIRRQLGSRPTRKAAVMKDDLKAMLANVAPTVTGKRDAALMLIGFGAALRRSELVALDVEDVTVCREGLKVRVKRSKTDQEAAGTEIAIARGRTLATDPVSAFEAWIAAAGITSGPVFRGIHRSGLICSERLTDRSVADIVKRLAEAAGLDAKRFSGHSLRAGLATSAAAAGATLTAIMTQTRHRSVDVAKTYVRDSEMWKDNVSGLVL